jgi:alkylation response protein AidB-like acyl-CoA dehydrogenase
MVDAGRPAQRESAVTKLFVAEAVWRIVEHAMQVLGEVLIPREALKAMDE